MFRYQRFLIGLSAAALFVAIVVGGSAAQAALLFVGSDHTEFGVGGAPPDILGRYTTNGANMTGGGTIATPYAFNGLGEGAGFLYAGQYDSTTMRRIDYAGNTIGVPFTAGVSSTQFNEDMAGSGGTLWHSYFGSASSGTVRQLDANGVLQNSWNVTDSAGNGIGVVGSALVGNQLWVTNWDGQTVGTFSTTTGIYTSVFSVQDPSGTSVNAGALAYDADTSVLWVGMQGGWVRPYNTAGVSLGTGFQPFGPTVGATIDGLALVTDSDLVPEPTAFAVWALLGILGIGVGWQRRHKA